MTTTGNVLASSGLALERIRQISITVRDPDRAVAFYRDILGLQLLFRAGHLAFFDCDGIRLMLSPPEKPEFDHPSSILYFKGEDIQRAYAELQARQVTTEGAPHLIAKMPDHDLWLSEFRDSEGNVMCLMAEVPR